MILRLVLSLANITKCHFVIDAIEDVLRRFMSEKLKSILSDIKHFSKGKNSMVFVNDCLE